MYSFTQFEVVWLGIAIAKVGPEYTIGITAHDGTWSLDYERYTFRDPDEVKPDPSVSALLQVTSSASEQVSANVSGDAPSQKDEDKGTPLEEFVLAQVAKFGHDHRFKAAGGAITDEAYEHCENLPARLWRALDIVCFVFKPFDETQEVEASSEDINLRVDEESDAMARKAVEWV